MDSNILIIEDEKRSAHWLKTYLERDGFRTETAHDGKTGLDLARKTNPDLILLDLKLPVIDGNEVCRIIRKDSNVPIIMLTSRGSKEDKITGLNEGADDYIVKPYEPEEVISRINAVLRRTKGAMTRTLSCGPMQIDVERQLVKIGSDNVPVSHAQFLILEIFMKNPGVVLTRRQIIEQAFDDEFDAYERAVDTHIKRLRKLIERENFKPIKTIYGGGYKLECDSQ